MRADGPSTLSQRTQLWGAIARNQTRLVEANAELSTGRHYEVNLTLGSNVGRNLLWRIDIAQLEANQVENERLLSRAELTQVTLDTLRDVGNQAIESFITARNSTSTQGVARRAAESALSTVLQALRSTSGGEYLFSGQNAAVPPVTDYQGGTGQAAVASTFVTTFGIPQSDANVANIGASAIKAYYDGPFDAAFQDPAWFANWSDASVENQRSRIEGNQFKDLSANANDTSLRQLIKALTAVADSGTDSLGQEAYQALIDKAVSTLKQSEQGITELQARIGEGQSTVRLVNDRLERQVSILKSEITRTEGVANEDAALRVNSLMTQLEISFNITARISQLSILKYI